MYPGPSTTVNFDGPERVKLVKWKVNPGHRLSKGTILLIYSHANKEIKYKCNTYGTITDLLVKEGNEIQPGQQLLKYLPCSHPTVMKDLCAECGQDLRELGETSGQASSASVSMIHSVPELRVTVEQAEKLGKADVDRLLKDRKLVLLVDLDQTLIHSTNDNAEGIEGVVKYHLYGPGSQVYYTKFRPHTFEFLEEISKYYELHICTFGARMYAHKIAELLDPTKKYFSHRILSRDECFDSTSKTGNLKGLFPCGDSLVCIIDDREDVWRDAPNLVAVKPYFFFKNTGDINSPFKKKDECIYQNTSGTFKPSELDKSDKPHDLPQNDQLTDSESTKEQEDVGEPATAENETQEAESEKSISSLPTTETEALKEESKHEEEKEITDESVEATQEESKTIKEGDNIPEPPRIDDCDDYLLYLEEILKRIHGEYFQRYDELIKYTSEEEYVSLPDLKQIIPDVKKRTLKGVNIVFSGVIPTNMPMKDSKLYQTAIAFGARVHKDINLDGSPLERTTHLVAAKYGTAKVNTALKTGKIYIVSPLWLLCCAERWEKVDEALFVLNKDDDFANIQERKLKSTHVPPNPSSSGIEKPDATEKQEDYPVYDPVTGKKVSSKRSDQQKKRSPSDDRENLYMTASSDLTPHNMLQFSPLSGFSKSDLQLMDKEVDDACSEGDELSTGNTDSEDEAQTSSFHKRKNDTEFLVDEDEESNNSEYPTGWSHSQPSKKCKYAYTRLEDDETRDSFQDRTDSSSNEDDFNESIGSADEEMAAAVEREFLS